MQDREAEKWKGERKVGETNTYFSQRALNVGYGLRDSVLRR